MEYMDKDQYLSELKDKKAKEAKKALELYRSGLTAQEIGQKMGKATITIWRYFQSLGGLSKKDEALHMQGRYLK